MKCPYCKVPMIVLELHQIEIDYCPGCGGIWLDAGELELLLEDPAKKDRLLSTVIENPDSKEKRIRCPVCQKKMRKAWAGTESKIEIDKCRKDHGLWFDRNELHHLVEQGSSATQHEVTDLLKTIFEYKLK